MILAALLWAGHGQVYAATEGTEWLSLPYDRRERGKGAQLRGKINTVSSSEVETLDANPFKSLPSYYSPKADPSTIADGRFCCIRLTVN